MELFFRGGAMASGGGGGGGGGNGKEGAARFQRRQGAGEEYSIFYLMREMKCAEEGTCKNGRRRKPRTLLFTFSYPRWKKHFSVILPLLAFPLPNYTELSLMDAPNCDLFAICFHARKLFQP
jgi:hypothetical protein